jgi:hypothetical protein
LFLFSEKKLIIDELKLNYPNSLDGLNIDISKIREDFLCANKRKKNKAIDRSDQRTQKEKNRLFAQKCRDEKKRVFTELNEEVNSLTKKNIITDLHRLGQPELIHRRRHSKTYYTLAH